MGSNIEAHFLQFHQDHPDVYRELVRLARAWKERYATKKLAIATIYEVLRWTSHMGRQDGQDYKLNNNYRSYYARLIMAQEADLAGLFELRVLRGDEQRLPTSRPYADVVQEMAEQAMAVGNVGDKEQQWD